MKFSSNRNEDAPEARKGGFSYTVFRGIFTLPPSDRLLLGLAALAVFSSLLWSAIVIDDRVSADVAAHDGALVEGVIGTPRFVNPVLAVTRADRDLAALIYAGVARLDEDGTIVPDLADTITVSEDGLVYNVILRGDAVFQDGAPLTSADVAFTIARIQDPSLSSPLRASWEGVRVEVIGERELNFVLSEAYAPFMENLTVGILPAHLWKDAGSEEFPFSQYNSEPVGAGPYKVGRVERDNSSIPESYTLEPFPDYHGEAAKIQALTLRFYTNEAGLIEAWKAKAINSAAGLSPEAIAELDIDSGEYAVRSLPLPRTFALFFNQNKTPALRDEGARRALEAAVDRDDLIERVLQGNGVAIHSPIPPGFGIEEAADEEPSLAPLDNAREILRNSGWEVNPDTGIWEKTLGEDETATPLTFSISTANTPVFEATAEYLRAQWGQLGAEVSVKQFEQSDLTQAVIRPRDYETLLFGTVVGRAFDFYSFWHSSQRNDPGLNVALYANITTDAILENIRRERDIPSRNAAVEAFAGEIEKEAPAIFLFAPEFTYILPTTIIGASFEGLAEPHERFANVSKWYVETESIWPIFR